MTCWWERSVAVVAVRGRLLAHGMAHLLCVAPPALALWPSFESQPEVGNCWYSYIASIFQFWISCRIIEESNCVAPAIYFLFPSFSKWPVYHTFSSVVATPVIWEVSGSVSSITFLGRLFHSLKHFTDKRLLFVVEACWHDRDAAV